MKKIVLLLGAGCIAMLAAAERTVDTTLISAPRTAYSHRDTEIRKKTSAGVDIRNRNAIAGTVILDNGNFGANNANLVYELQIGNLKRIKLRTASGAPSLVWATYDANGEVCRLGPAAQVETSSAADAASLAKYEIVFTPQEKIFCFSVGKAVRSKMKILYFMGSAAADAAAAEK